MFDKIDFGKVKEKCIKYLQNKYEDNRRFIQDQLKSFVLKTIEINLRHAKRALIKKANKNNIIKKKVVPGINWKLESTNKEKFMEQLNKIKVYNNQKIVN